MTQISKLKDTAAKWQSKAMTRRYQLKKNKQIISYHKKIAHDLRLEVISLKEELEARVIARSEIANVLQDRQAFTVMIRLDAVISFRSIPKVLSAFNYPNVPHFTSVINWSLRCGLGLLAQIEKSNLPWVAIMDHSIDFGTKKVFVVLRVYLSNIKEGKAITLKDCECIGLKLCEKVTGESVCEDLREIFNISGVPDLVIKDSDSTLNKGLRLYNEVSGAEIPSTPDIGHVVGNALKAEFGNARRYKNFIRIATNGASRIRQTSLAYITPPKLRSKGRFQSIGKLSEWSNKMLQVFTSKGKAKEGSDLDRIRKAFPGLVALKNFIISFSLVISKTSELMKVLKTQGLSVETYSSCLLILSSLPERSKTRQRIEIWLEENVSLVQSLPIERIPVSSDVIESLFGNFKFNMSRSSMSEMNRSVLLIPALCGNQTHESISKAINMASLDNVQKWIEENVDKTMRQKRMMFFNEESIQKEEENKAA